MNVVDLTKELWWEVGTDAPKFQVGDRVDLKRWDASEPPAKRLGIQRVIAVHTGQRCESGVMVTVTGRLRDFDQNWLTLAKEQQPELLKLKADV